MASYGRVFFNYPYGTTPVPGDMYWYLVVIVTDVYGLNFVLNSSLIEFFLFVFKCSRSLQHVSRVCHKLKVVHK